MSVTAFVLTLSHGKENAKFSMYLTTPAGFLNDLKNRDKIDDFVYYFSSPVKYTAIFHYTC